jgi:uncharacterized membrane protein (UPF0127 family)
MGAERNRGVSRSAPIQAPIGRQALSMRNQRHTDGTARSAAPFLFSADRRTSAAACAIALLAVALPACRPAAETRPRQPQAAQPLPASDRLVVVTAGGRHEISLEVADTEHKKMVGLMFRTALARGHGMLFPYAGDQEVTMWMRNTYIPLDMVFIRGDGVVHRIAYDTEPMSEAIIASQGPVSAVLELFAGEAKRLGITPGSRVEHAHFRAPVQR